MLVFSPGDRLLIGVWKIVGVLTPITTTRRRVLNLGSQSSFVAAEGEHCIRTRTHLPPWGSQPIDPPGSRWWSIVVLAFSALAIIFVLYQSSDSWFQRYAKTGIWVTVSSKSAADSRVAIDSTTTQGDNTGPENVPLETDLWDVETPEIEFKPAITGAAPRFAIVTGGFHTLEGLYLVDSINCVSGPTVRWVDLQRPSEYRVIYWNVGSFCPWDSRLRASGLENAPPALGACHS